MTPQHFDAAVGGAVALLVPAVLLAEGMKNDVAAVPGGFGEVLGVAIDAVVLFFGVAASMPHLRIQSELQFSRQRCNEMLSIHPFDLLVQSLGSVNHPHLCSTRSLLSIECIRGTQWCCCHLHCCRWMPIVGALILCDVPFVFL